MLSCIFKLLSTFSAFEKIWQKRTVDINVGASYASIVFCQSHDSMWCICVTSYLSYVIYTWMQQNIQRRLSKAKYNNWNTPYKTVPSHVASGRVAKGLKGRTDIIRRECITYYCIRVRTIINNNNNIILSCLIISRDGHRRRRE